MFDCREKTAVLFTHGGCGQGLLHLLRLLSIPLLLSGSVGAYACDTYDLATNRLTIPIGALGTTVYTDVVVTVDPNTVVLASGPAKTTYDTYTSTTNRLSIPCVQVGNQRFNNVTVAVDSVISVGAVYNAPIRPLLALINPLPGGAVGDECATVGQHYANPVWNGVLPDSSYTYMIDTLAVGNGVPTGMTLDMNGVLSGTPFATGRADVYGNQIRHFYTFGVCAVDTLSRTSTSPCPQTTICVDPPKYALTKSVVGSGIISASSPGPNYPSGTVVTLTATPNAGYTFSGWSGACAGTGSCVVTMGGNKTVTATFAAAPTPSGVSVAITSATCDTQHLTLSGTVSGPPGTFLTYGLSHFTDFSPKCQSWLLRNCRRAEGESLVSTWTSTNAVNVGDGRIIALSIKASFLAPYPILTTDEASASGTVTCHRSS